MRLSPLLPPHCRRQHATHKQSSCSPGLTSILCLQCTGLRLGRYRGGLNAALFACWSRRSLNPACLLYDHFRDPAGSAEPIVKHLLAHTRDCHKIISTNVLYAKASTQKSTRRSPTWQQQMCHHTRAVDRMQCMCSVFCSSPKPTQGVRAGGGKS